jgi:hypothetical protein
MLESIRGLFGNRRVFNPVIHWNTSINKASMLFFCVCEHDQKANCCLYYRNFAKELVLRIANWKDNG